MSLLKCCPQCGEKKNIVKNGKRRSDKQCYKCKNCGRQFTESIKTEYPLEIRYIALKLAYAKVGYREVAKLLNIKRHTSIHYWSETLSLPLCHNQINKNKICEIAKKIKSQILTSNEVEQQKAVVDNLKYQLEQPEIKPVTVMQRQLTDEESEKLENAKKQIDELERYPGRYKTNDWLQSYKKAKITIIQLQPLPQINKPQINKKEIAKELARETKKLNRLESKCNLKLDRYIAPETLDVLDEIVNDFT